MECAICWRFWRGSPWEAEAADEQVGRLSFGSIVAQSLPFYSGAVTYHIPFSLTDTGTLSVCIPNYHAALLKCSIDDAPECPIAFSPYE